MYQNKVINVAKQGWKQVIGLWIMFFAVDLAYGRNSFYPMEALVADLWNPKIFYGKLKASYESWCVQHPTGIFKQERKYAWQYFVPTCHDPSRCLVKLPVEPCWFSFLSFHLTDVSGAIQAWNSRSWSSEGIPCRSPQVNGRRQVENLPLIQVTLMQREKVFKMEGKINWINW